MTALFDQYFAAPRQERAARLDNAAVADPSQFNNAELADAEAAEESC